MAKWGPNRLFTLTSAADRGWSLFGTVQFWYSQDFSALLGNIFPLLCPLSLSFVCRQRNPQALWQMRVKTGSISGFCLDNFIKV
jgi:hypothetical protein